jgi:DNA-binding XRE family transcriptional regulator
MPRAKAKPPKQKRAPATLLHRETPRFRKATTLLAKRLRKLRAEKDWTIEKACEAIGIEPMSLYRLEYGKSNPSLALLLDLAAAFGLSVSELLDFDRKA